MLDKIKNQGKIRKIFNRKTATVAGGLLVASVAGIQLTTAELPAKEQVYGQSIEKVLQIYKEAGFENIKESLKIADLEYGKIDESSKVEVVLVDGEEWKEGTASKNVPISISYHAPKDDAVELSNLSYPGNVTELEKELIETGFDNIELSSVMLLAEGNNDKHDQVENLEIGSYSYQKGYFYSTSLPVKVTYFDASKDNLKFPQDALETKNKADLEKSLTEVGFTQVKWDKIEEKDKSKHGTIRDITVDGEKLRLDTKQDIILKKATPIVISYYDFSNFAEVPKDISNATVEKNKELFTAAGFTQISEVATETDDISKNGQVSVIEIDGKAWDSQKDTVYKKNSKVVIKYWNAEKAIAEKARKEEEERQAAEAKRIAEERAAAQAQAAAQSQGQIHGFAQAPASNVYYPNCKAARAAGAAPVYQGQPGYGSHLDRDGDGIGCE